MDEQITPQMAHMCRVHPSLTVSYSCCRSEPTRFRVISPLGSLGLHLDCRHDLPALRLQHLQLCLKACSSPKP